MKSFTQHITIMETPSARLYTERGLSSYLRSAEQIVRNAQSRSGDFARMQDVHISAVLGRLVGHITRIVSTVPRGTDPKTIAVAKSLMAVGSRAALLKKNFDEMGRSGAALAARLSNELQGKYDLRFESVVNKSGSLKA